MKKIFENIWFEISCRWSRISNWFYDFKYGIKNLIKWFPIIWQDRDWDFAFMFALLEKKFENYEKEWETKATKYVVGSEKQIKRFKICKELCRRLKDDWYYHENTFMFHDKKWGALDFRLSTEENDLYSISRLKVSSPEDDELERKQSMILYKIENDRKDADVELLQMYIKKYWKTWWW